MSDSVFSSSQTKHNLMKLLQIKWILQKRVCTVDRVIETRPVLLRLSKHGALSDSNPNVSKIHTDVFYETHSNHYFMTFFTKHTNFGLHLNSQKHTSTNRGHSRVWNATQLHLLFQPPFLASWSVYFYRGVKKKKKRGGGQAGREGQCLPLGGYIWAVTLYLAHLMAC